MGQLPSTAEKCSWSISVVPQYGWGPPLGKQRATAGWLAAFPVFEPHWQACCPFATETARLVHSGRDCRVQSTLYDVAGARADVHGCQLCVGILKLGMSDQCGCVNRKVGLA